MVPAGVDGGGTEDRSEEYGLYTDRRERWDWEDGRGDVVHVIELGTYYAVPPSQPCTNTTSVLKSDSTNVNH
jgi:hypothetical protein